jgi:hypothetical protein
MQFPGVAGTKLTVGDWLQELGLVVFDERPNPGRPQWGLFTVRSVQPGRRSDLLVCGHLTAAQHRLADAHVAIEIKPGHKHHDILDGFDAVLEYFTDYLWGTTYLIGGAPVEVAAFVLATSFSKEGYLFGAEGKFDPRGIVRGPWDAYPMTFTIARLLWRQRDNIIKRIQSLAHLPSVDRRLAPGARIQGAREADRLPAVGVLVAEPRSKDSARLMLSRHPYHWRLEAQASKTIAAGHGNKGNLKGSHS